MSRTLDVQKILEKAFNIAAALIADGQIDGLTVEEVVKLSIELALVEEERISVLPTATVDKNNVAFSIGLNDVALVKGNMNFLANTEMTVWNYIEDDDDQD